MTRRSWSPLTINENDCYAFVCLISFTWINCNFKKLNFTLETLNSYKIWKFLHHTIWKIFCNYVCILYSRPIILTRPHFKCNSSSSKIFLNFVNVSWCNHAILLAKLKIPSWPRQGVYSTILGIHCQIFCLDWFPNRNGPRFGETWWSQHALYSSFLWVGFEIAKKTIKSGKNILKYSIFEYIYFLN